MTDLWAYKWKEGYTVAEPWQRNRDLSKEEIDSYRGTAYTYPIVVIRMVALDSTLLKALLA